MAINGLTFIVDNNGITLQGSLEGSSRPDISALLNNTSLDRRLIVYSKTLYISSQINSVNNPNLILPLSFGNNKFIIEINGEIFFPGVDFITEQNNNNIVKWLSTQAINKTDVVNAWGPANAYTAQGITFETIDLNDSNKFTSGSSPVITLNLNGANELLPYNESCIYLIIDRKVYKPGVDFTYSSDDGNITWLINSTIPIIPGTTSCSTFYYNKVVTEPFKLGQILSRNIYNAISDHQSDFTIALPPKSSLNTGSNLFLLQKRYGYGSNYTINSPKFYVQNPSKLKDDIVIGSKVDFSYFKDVASYTPVTIISQELSAGITSDSGDSNLFPTVFVPANQINISNKKVLVFFNGEYVVGENYDNGTIGSLYSGTVAQYTRDNTGIKWKSNRLTPSIVPTADDIFDVVAFNDSLSQAGLNIEYFKRTNSSGPDSITLQKDIKSNKAVMFYNGEVCVKANDDFSINVTNKKLIDGLPYSRPAASRFDDVVVLYACDDAYAGLINFDFIKTDSNYPTGSNFVFANPIVNKQSCILFINSRRARASEFDLVHGNPNSLSITSNISSGSKLLLIHL
jgi:hypothetical protein